MKRARTKKTKTAKKTARRPARSAAGNGIALSVKTEGLEPILGAAYLMMDRAWVALSGDKKKTIVVSLSPKAGGSAAALEKQFRAELESQKVRWAIARNNLPIREYVAEQAVLIANGTIPPPQPPAPEPAAPAEAQLTSEQRDEIERLIAEVEAEIKDMNAKKAVPDPKNVKASWEAAQDGKASSGA